MATIHVYRDLYHNISIAIYHNISIPMGFIYMGFIPMTYIIIYEMGNSDRIHHEIGWKLWRFSSPVAPQALSTCKGLPQGGKIAGDLWWLTKFGDLLGSKIGLPHVSWVKLWATQCYSATLLRSPGKNKMDRMRQPFWRLKNRSTMINPWQNLGDWVRFSASKPETPNRLLDMRLTNAHRCHDVFRQPKSFMEDVHFAGTTLLI